MNDINTYNGDGSPFDAIRRVSDVGSEYWSARDLQPFMGYRKWQDFQNAIERAKAAASNAGHDAEKLFVQVTQLMDAGNLGQQERVDYRLPRFACYLTFLNGDPRKPEVAAAQAYFAIRTREAETRPAAPALRGPELVALALVEANQMLEAKDARIAQQDQQLAVQAPKVTYVDTYVADADLLSFSTVASTNGITEKALRQLLIGKDWIFIQTDSRWSDTKGKKVTRNRYSEKASKKRYFRRVENHEAPRFRGSEVMHTLKVTPQGAEAIARLVAKEQAA